MEQHETQYRGYNIKAKHRGQDWFLSVTPSRPELPLLRRYSFRAKVISAEDAICQAKRRVDWLLDLSSLFRY